MLLSDEEIVEKLCAIEEGLTPWELDFVDSVAKQVEGKRPLSDRQRDVVDRIFERLEL